MTEVTSLASILGDVTAALPDVRSTSAGGRTEWSRGGVLFATLEGEVAELRLDPAIASAAIKTPDTPPTRDVGPLRTARARWPRHRPGDRVVRPGVPTGRGHVTGAHYEALDRYVEERLPVWTEELAAFCRIPSEAADPPALGRAADWIADRLGRLGAAIDVVEVENAPPLVVGELGRVTPSCCRLDVQPAEPLELWTSGPYDPRVRDGRLYARGACDNKGELMARVWGIEAYRETIGELPCRVRFLVQGQEEGGGDGFRRLLAARPGILKADGALSEGGDSDSSGRAVVYGGVRGMVMFELVCRTIAYDAHSSLANLLPSATIRLVRALSTFWDDEGVPAIEGLESQVRPPTPAQLALVDGMGEDELAELLPAYGVDRFIAGRRGREANHVLTFGTTLNVQGLWSGYTGPGEKTITPAEAHARIDVRLVPDQDHTAVLDVIRRHLASHGFGDIELLPHAESYRAWWTPPDDPILAAAMRASTDVLGLPALQVVSAAGTEPMYDVAGANDLPTSSLGAADEHVRAHAPDESYRLEDATKAARMLGRFLDEFAAIGR
jgi:acetylornithine deacetylase/succinyl-diaminopimelate desuccinylase-like protein